MKINKVLSGIILLIVVLGIVLMSRCSHRNHTNSNSMERQYDRWRDSVTKSYKAIIKSKEDSIISSQNKERVYQDTIAFYKAKLSENKEKVAQIRTSGATKIAVIKKSTSDDLSKFFVDRYKGEASRNKTEGVNPAANLVIADSILRPAAQDILLGDQNKSELDVSYQSIDYLNQIISNKDSLLNEKSKQVNLKEGIIISTNAELFLSMDDNKRLKKQYSNLKVNDRLKMGLGGTIIAGLVYLLIAK